VLFFGIVLNADGCVFCCNANCVTTPTPTPFFDNQGRQIFQAKNGSQFWIVVEGGSAPDRATPGTSLVPTGPDQRPDLQIESMYNLGNGSTAVCDTGPASMGGGGIPGINPPSFAPQPSPGPTPGTIAGALADFACRFDPTVSASSPCTLVDQMRDAKTISPGAVVQFCDSVAPTAAFPPGDTILTVQLRDLLFNFGPPQQIVVRVATPTPTTIPTP